MRFPVISSWALPYAATALSLTAACSSNPTHAPPFGPQDSGAPVDLATAAAPDLSQCTQDTLADGSEAHGSVDLTVRVQFDTPIHPLDGTKAFGLAHYPAANERSFYLPRIKAAGIDPMPLIVSDTSKPEQMDLTGRQSPTVGNTGGMRNLSASRFKNYPPRRTH